ncbi:unnamed protein product [Acanthoscelides obtectus]|uniref:DUF4797 domain-containing protein n=1 Tax=Acanthoscelides obtectus TaxID=200917 RepID=A0A9P0L4C2_ACAOB|nr:unnamed protein product [Acanthoscelides obtectus]CAK1652886.1 hypothetical protein AOBTE_LOCUS17957 [Acanthoscelides obtectus]
MNSVMPRAENNLFLLRIASPESRSPSPLRETKGIRLFRAIGRKLARRSNEDFQFVEDPDSRSSSSDSCSSTSVGRDKKQQTSSDSGFRSASPNHMSSSSSEAGSDIQVRSRHHHSTSAESIRRAFQNLNVSTSTRSQSCHEAKEKRKTKKPPPKRILRQPVSYTYAKGLSGLPTQRIPKNSKMYSKSCGCSMQYTFGLNR